MSPSRAAVTETPLIDELGFLLTRAGAAVSALARQRLRPLGLHIRTYSVLALAGSETGRTQREVAEFLGLDPSQVVALVDELEGLGLVTRDPVPGDRRSRLVRATEQGLSKLAAARATTADAERESSAALSDDERGALRTLLQKADFTTASPRAE